MEPGSSLLCAQVLGREARVWGSEGGDLGRLLQRCCLEGWGCAGTALRGSGNSTVYTGMREKALLPIRTLMPSGDIVGSGSMQRVLPLQAGKGGGCNLGLFPTCLVPRSAKGPYYSGCLKSQLPSRATNWLVRTCLASCFPNYTLAFPQWSLTWGAVHAAQYLQRIPPAVRWLLGGLAGPPLACGWVSL